MATKKVKETEEIKETKEETVKAEVNLDVEAMMAKMKAELMKEIEEYHVAPFKKSFCPLEGPPHFPRVTWNHCQFWLRTCPYTLTVVC